VLSKYLRREELMHCVIWQTCNFSSQY